MLTPLHCGIPLCEHIGIPHLILGLRLKHVDRGVGLGDKVWLILQMIGAGLIENLELAFGRLEPLLRLAIKNDSENTFRL